MKANANDQDTEIQPYFELRFERSHSHSARGQCLVDVFLKNNGVIAASFPFFCLTDLGLNVSPAPGWDKQEIISVRKIQRVTSCEMNSSTLESNAAAHCCTIILSYKSSFGGCLEFEPRSEYLLANFPNLNLMCVVGAGNYPSKRILLQVPATALRKIITEAMEQDGVIHSAQTPYDIADSEFTPVDIGVTVSIGCAERRPNTMPPEDLVKAADTALYQAKETGRNRVVSAGKGASSVANNGKQELKRKRRVVIIDDDPAFVTVLTKMVSDLGYDVMISTDARSSHTYEVRNSDIVFVDVLMPHVDGLQVLEQLARQNGKYSIVLMSGQGERLDEAEKLANKLDLQLVGVLEKPFRLGDVAQTLEAL